LTDSAKGVADHRLRHATRVTLAPSSIQTRFSSTKNGVA